MNYKLKITNFNFLAIFGAIIFAVFSFGSAQAQSLSPAQEERFNKLALEIRCVVCQSEPVATSQAKIAIDMRGVIRQRIALGEGDKQVRQYFADHYGENVLLRPQFNKATISLWVTPFFLLAFGGVFLFGLFRMQKAQEIAEPKNGADKDDEIEIALKSLED